METIRCTYCGRRGDDRFLEVDLRGVRYDYCDAACATAHRMAVELAVVLCTDCDEDVVGDTGLCPEHLDAGAPETDDGHVRTWRRAG